MRKLNRRTNWKFARDRVRALFDKGFANPASVGPAGRSSRFFRFFGGVDKTVIQANSEQRYWERLDRHCRALAPEALGAIQTKRAAKVAYFNQKCAICARRRGQHYSDRCSLKGQTLGRFEVQD